MTSIPLLVETSECQQFGCIYIKNKAFCLIYFYVFRLCIKFPTFLKKDDPHSVCIFEITDNERRAEINV